MKNYTYIVSVADGHTIVEAVHEHESDSRHAYALIVPMIDDYKETVGFLLRDAEWDSIDPDQYQDFTQHYTYEAFVGEEPMPDLVKFWVNALPKLDKKGRRSW